MLSEPCRAACREGYFFPQRALDSCSTMGKGTYLHHLGAPPLLAGDEQHLLTASALLWKPLRAAECICCLASPLVSLHITAREIIAPTHAVCLTDVRDGDGYICSQIKKQFKMHPLPAVTLWPVSF